MRSRHSGRPRAGPGPGGRCHESRTRSTQNQLQRLEALRQRRLVRPTRARSRSLTWNGSPSASSGSPRRSPTPSPATRNSWQALGISRNTLAALLTRYELAGWGRRVLIPGGQGQATGRLGFVLFVRPTNRPVATPASFDQIVKMMHADINRTKGRPRTVPFASLRAGSVPNFWGPWSPISGERWLPKFWGPPISSKEEEVTAQKTTTTGESSSSFLTPSHQTQDPEPPDRAESLGPVASESHSGRHASTHVEAEAPPPVPELPAELAVHQALLIAIMARFAASFGKPLDQARTILIGLWGEFRTKAKARGFTFDVRWIGEALDETEKAKAGRKIKASPVGVLPGDPRQVRPAGRPGA